MAEILRLIWLNIAKRKENKMLVEIIITLLILIILWFLFWFWLAIGFFINQ